MNEPRAMTDAEQRARALDPGCSFIVQAPAGSGKTELLIQRYLALLAQVDQPEEIVAITFTIKAAAEMRERVVQALGQASRAEAPAEQHRRVSWTLARAARQRDAQQGWQLSDSPARLRIETIDALCAGLARQMPVLSGFGAMPAIVEDAEDLYREAARRTLAEIGYKGVGPTAVLRVLQHLDGNTETAEKLLVDMLARRDQWLRHVADRRAPSLQRDVLEAGLAALVVDALTALRGMCPSALERELCTLARYAAAQLRNRGTSDGVAELDRLLTWPGTDTDDLAQWRNVAELVLTGQGAVRKKVTLANGFPAPSTGSREERAGFKHHKDRMEQLLAALGAETLFVDALHRTRSLPPPRYTEQQWAIVQALSALLPFAVAQLKVLFRERGQIDFTESAQAALNALGTEDEPTDLALALDCRIRHLLVDEFQDTSQSQYELLARLTAGWQTGDGRTLFVVGDPMQSIYRFREADVSLYLRARNEGVGTLTLEPLTLQTNFRSHAALVDWVNRTFQTLLADAEDPGVGAVPYSPSEAARAPLPGTAVSVHPLASSEGEAAIVVDTVRAAHAEVATQRIAIVVRSRSHLLDIIPALKAAGMRFQAIEIEPLGQRPLVLDLYALTRALLHPADRVSWLSVLRAPWCGLTLADLDALARTDHSACVWDLMTDGARVETMSADGARRLGHLRERLQACFARRRRTPLRRWIEGAWLALGGPAAAGDVTELADARTFFTLLDELEEGGDLPDFALLQRRVEQLYALPDAGAGDALQIMTMHKAKGLEFDVVIVPGLGRDPPPDDPSLLLWWERPRAHGKADLLLAPIRKPGADNDPIYDHLRDVDAMKGEHEDGRLLYVAATRARSRLHLIGHASMKDGMAEVSKRSLLSRLWPAVEVDFQREAQRLAALAAPQALAVAEAPPAPPTVLRRYPAAWVPPMPERSSLTGAIPSAPAAEPQWIEFAWATELAKHVGTVVHRWLQSIAEEGIDGWRAERVPGVRAALAHELSLLGVPAGNLDEAASRTAAALAAALNDARARWLLTAHAEAQSELRLTGVIDGEVVNVIVDRTFVDEHGTRWIVDYKTGVHEGAQREAFLDNERERYRPQLERYAALLERLDSRPIRLALYFPLLAGWREWSR